MQSVSSANSGGANDERTFEVRHVNRGTAPPLLQSLANIDPSRRWSGSGEKEVHAAIREGLRHNQHRACAYCERMLPEGGAVEHVHPKSCPSCVAGPSPSNWHYHWENLLLVCGSTKHCDGLKADDDICGQALFPDGMMPGRRYLEVNSLTGELTVAQGLDGDVEQRVLHSIKAFALNDPELKAIRKAVVETLLKEALASGEAMARHRAASTLGFATTVDSFFS